MDRTVRVQFLVGVRLTNNTISRADFAPTTDDALNDVLFTLVSRSQQILNDNFVGAYLHGSFALSAWDQHSDVDFLIAVGEPVSEAELDQLQALHGEIFELPVHWAQHLEGTYFPVSLLRQPNQIRQHLPFLDNTNRVLRLSDHDDTLVVRWMLREHGLVLTGPEPQTLIDPIEPDALRREVWEKMQRWEREINAEPEMLNNGWFQPYCVLSYCRMLHSLHTGQVASKPVSAEWARATLDPIWHDLIGHAWAERPFPSIKVNLPASEADISLTLSFIRHVMTLKNPLVSD